MAGLARSGEVGLLVSASASSVIEVEPEVNVSRCKYSRLRMESCHVDDIYLSIKCVQGDFLVAFDPLTFGSGGLVASSTFGVWQK